MAIGNKFPFKLKNYDEEFAFANLIEIDMKKLRDKEDMLSDHIPKNEIELQQVVDTLFEDDNTTDEMPNLKTVYYIKLIKTKPGAPKGVGSELFSRILKELKGKDVLFCLYASPIHPEKGKYYSFKERKVALPKLLEVYRKLGFKSHEDDEQVMYRK